MHLPEYKPLSLTEIKSKISFEQLILLVTATETETRATHSALYPISGEKSLLTVFANGQTYYFGQLGLYNIVHVQCTMGSVARSSSTVTVKDALQLFGIKIVMMVGIAFGVDERSQRIGDVLVSESIRPYNSRRVGDVVTIQRGIEMPASRVLLNRFRNVQLTWQYPLSAESNASLVFTRMLSGEDLVDNMEYREQLKATYPDSKGGEMEGAGVASACDSQAEWIIVKGICDYADGNKAVDKEERQKIAINAALSVFMEVFSNRFAFNEFEIHPVNDSKETIRAFNFDTASRVLFEVYDKSKEHFYVIRNEDEIFSKTLTQFGIWIWGNAGCGKSNLIVRNLLNKNHEFIQVSLASCDSIDQYFDEILYEIHQYFEAESGNLVYSSTRDRIRSIVGTLNNFAPNKELVLFIDEIPISKLHSDKEFSEKLFSLIIELSRIPSLNKMRIVLSSLNDPRQHIQLHNQKILSLVSFLSFTFWQKSDAEKLIFLIEAESGLNISQELKTNLLTRSKGSPRFIKKFFRSYLALGTNDETALKEVLADIETELKTYCHV